MFDWLRSRSRRQVSQSRAVPLRVSARYDAAATTDDNRRHWANADALAPNSANSLVVRKTLRNRARYETANNSYAKGIVLTLANDTIGTGPRLQMLTEDVEANSLVEKAFGAWTAAAGLAEKLRTMRMSKGMDGESFGVLSTNLILNSPVKLDLRLIETDQITSQDPKTVDGIAFDGFGNPTTYTVLKNHPGSSGASADADSVQAASMLHYFRVDRPGQARGIPEITPSLSLFAQLRRYTLAVIGAAEMAADMAAVIQTDAPPEGAAEVSAFDTVDLERKMATVMPEGWKLGQVKAEQPATTYSEFKEQILAEIARCLNVPFNVAAGNSSGYNYASGRLDFQTYFKSIRVEQSVIEGVILDRIFAAWLAEAILVAGYLPESMRAIGATFEHQWFWDGTEHVDPSKEANAQETRLANNTTTLAEEYAKRGRDWEAEIRQRAKEINLCKELGVSIAPPAEKPPEPMADEKDDEPAPAKANYRKPFFVPTNGR